MVRRRQLFIVLGGLLLLGLMTLFGSSLESWLPTQASADIQSAQAGPYTVTLQVNPNPPSAGQTAELSLLLVATASRQLVSHAQVTINSAMADMIMGSEVAQAKEFSPGRYRAQADFSMRGAWLVSVTIALPHVAPAQVQFSVVAR
jgi:hypothetical protein